MQIDSPIKEQQKPKNLSLFQLFRYCNKLDVLMLVIGIFASIAAGIFVPFEMFLMGDMIDKFSFHMGGESIEIPNSKEVNEVIFEDLETEVNDLALIFFYFAIGNFFAGALQVFCFYMLNQRQIIKIRLLYFWSLMKQDAGWHDLQNSGDLTNRINKQLNDLENGISLKFGNLFKIISTFITGYVMGLCKCWDLALVFIACAPFYLLSVFLFGFFTKLFVGLTAKGYAISGNIAEETITNIKTVHALGKIEDFSNMYYENNQQVKKFLAFRTHSSGIAMGMMMFFLMGSLAIGTWYATLIITGKGGSTELTPGSILVVFLTISAGNEALSSLNEPLTAIGNAKVAGYLIFSAIDRKPDIDSSSDSGLKPEKCEGKISIENVSFSYPTRPDKEVLKNINIQCSLGHTIAFVGSSGCGKSSIIKLLQRMYDPTSGSIKLDGIELKDLNLSWLRNEIAVVSQEPILFSATIKENILFGSRLNDEISDDELFNVCQLANCHDFIMSLPEKYDTIIGERGASLSGGQKQRIAIARALIRKPKILLLDEATSALDTQNEKAIFESLSKTSDQRTTIIICHRLSSIINSSLIIVFDEGQIIEWGIHDDLMKNKSLYYNLVEKENYNNNRLNDLYEYQETQMLGNKQTGHRITLKINETLERRTVAEDMKNEYKKEMEELNQQNKHVFWRIIKNNVVFDYIFLLIGTIGTLGSGVIQPYHTIILINIIVILSDITPGVSPTDEELEELYDWSVHAVIVSAITFLTYYLFVGFYFNAGTQFQIRNETRLFESIIKQEISWFDRQENKVGSLLTKLHYFPITMKAVVGERIGWIIQSISQIVCSMVVSLYLYWQIGLSIFALSPLIIIILVMDGIFNKSTEKPGMKAYEQSGITLNEVSQSISTIQSNTREVYFYNKYQNEINPAHSNIWKWGPITSLIGGLNNFVVFGLNAYSYYISLVILKKNLDFNSNPMEFTVNLKDGFWQTQKCLMMIVYVNQVVASSGKLFADIGKSTEAARVVYNIIDRIPKINTLENDGDDVKEIKQGIQFTNVCFRYPTQPEKPILTGINYFAEMGKSIVIVGESGCGKTTLLQLIERFYDPTFGSISIDGNCLVDLNINQVRSNIGYVSQEPVLFDASIIDNINMGIPPGLEVTQDDVLRATTIAKCHDFISQLPEGYNTKVGNKGSQLSGGQKQRIALARALIRKPKILLLDEATSALDAESELLLLDLLNKSKKDRITITVAHRLSTIQNADEILYLEKGKIVEKGTHHELMQKKGRYYNLVMTSSDHQ